MNSQPFRHQTAHASGPYGLLTPVLLLLLAASRAALAQNGFPWNPVLVAGSPPDAAATNMSLILKAAPGTYTIQAATGFPAVWMDETNITVGGGGYTNISLPLEGYPSLLLRAKENGVPPALGIETLANSFQPEIFCGSNAPQPFVWDWSDGSTATNYPIASKTFTASAARCQRLMTDPGGITGIDLGFTAADGGTVTPLPIRPAQNVSAVWFQQPLTNLTCWAASYNLITNTLDFSGFNNLQFIECYNCTPLPHVKVANLPALRRACFEACNLHELDLSYDPNLEDLRGALNAYTQVVVGGGTGPKIWHWCTRDNPQLTQRFADIMTNFLSLQELYIWNDNQSGPLQMVSTNLTDVRANSNNFTAADFTGQRNLWRLNLFQNSLTNLVINGCIGMEYLDVHSNQLPSSVLDTLLQALESAPNLQSVDLRWNAQPPSSAGYGYYSNLVKRGVTVRISP